MKRRNGFRLIALAGLVLALLVSAAPGNAATYTVRLGDAPFITGGGVWWPWNAGTSRRSG